jgi:hypothetical protein
MNINNFQNKSGGKVLFIYLLPFIPFGLYLLTSVGLLPIKIMSVVWVIAITTLIVFGLWKLWQGITNKNGRVLAYAIMPLAFACLAFFHEYGYIDSSLFFFLLLFSVGVSWLIEKLLLKIWERTG